MTLMEKEILSQPEAVRHAAEANADCIRSFVAAAKARGVSQIVTAARGSSDNACTYFKYLCEIYAGIPVSSAAPGVMTLYGGRPDMSHAAVIGVSQSGAAADVIAVIETARAQGAVTAAITNNKDSALAKAAEYSVFMDVGEEKSVAATKTFTSQMYLLARIADELSGGQVPALDRVPALIDETIRSARRALEAEAQRVKDMDDCYVLSRGIMYAAAQESALKIQETTYTHARAYAVSDFYHGPFAVVDSDTHVILLAAAGKAQKDNLDMLGRLEGAGADVTLLSSDPAVAGGTTRITIPKSEESIAPFAFVTAAQLFALSLSLSRGLNPDAPRGLKKVTVTK